jgi:hypothetical protein
MLINVATALDSTPSILRYSGVLSGWVCIVLAICEYGNMFLLPLIDNYKGSQLQLRRTWQWGFFFFYVNWLGLKWTMRKRGIGNVLSQIVHLKVRKKGASRQPCQVTAIADAGVDVRLWIIPRNRSRNCKAYYGGDFCRTYICKNI